MGNEHRPAKAGAHNRGKSEGLPHGGIGPYGTSAGLECGGKMRRSASWTKHERNM